MPRVTFNYRDSGAPADFKAAMALFDCDGTGFVDKQKLVNAANSQKKLKGQNAVLTKVVGVLVVLLCLFTAAGFGLTLKALDMAKDSQILGGQMTDKVTGELVQVASADMAVVDGKLVARSNGASTGPVAVAGSMPRVQSVEFESTKDEDESIAGLTFMRIDASAVEQAANYYREQGVGAFVVEMPGQLGLVATSVAELSKDAQGNVMATGFTSGGTRRWDLFCLAKAATCEIAATKDTVESEGSLNDAGLARRLQGPGQSLSAARRRGFCREYMLDLYGGKLSNCR